MPPWKCVTKRGSCPGSPAIRGFRFFRTDCRWDAAGTINGLVPRPRANASSSTPRLDANDHDRSRARPPIRAVTAQIPAKQRGFSALRFSDPGLPPRRRPRPFAASPESCQAKSEPYGARAACPLAAGLDPPPPCNSEHGCDICLRRSSAANHLASIISKHQIIATVSAIPGPLASR